MGKLHGYSAWVRGDSWSVMRAGRPKCRATLLMSAEFFCRLKRSDRNVTLGLSEPTEDLA